MKLAEKELSYQKEFLEALFKNSMEAIILIDQNHHVVDINEKFSELFSYDLAEIKGMNMDDVLDTAKDGSADRDLTKSVLRGKTFIHESTRYSKDGRPIDVMIKGVPVVIDGEFVGGYGIYSDISERKRNEEKLQHISLHDQLTGLFNRTYFEEEMRRLALSRDYPISIISADLDGLKLVNDAMGHAKGDKLLKACADVLRLSLRRSDILARVGGDEFIILLPLTPKKTGQEILKRIRTRAAKHPELPLSISLGIATADNNSVSLDDVYKKADDLMYRDKKRRKSSTHNRFRHKMPNVFTSREQE